MRYRIVPLMLLAGILLGGCLPPSQSCTDYRTRTISQSAADPDFHFNEKQTIGFIPIYFQDWYRRPSPLLSDQQRQDLFACEVNHFREEPIFWSPGDRSRGFSELQEKQMYGYFKSALATHGYELSYLPLERTNLHGSRTTEELAASGMTPSPLSLKNKDLMAFPDSSEMPPDSVLLSFTIPLSPDRILADSVRVRYRTGKIPDLIMQAWFFQQGADYVRISEPASSGTNLVTRPRPRPDVYAQGVWLQVWAQPPYYKLNVWSGALLRTSTTPDIRVQAKQMIDELLRRENFPTGLAAQTASR